MFVRFLFGLAVVLVADPAVAQANEGGTANRL